ncbi:carbohydrate-binding domain-containing protein [Arenibaculum sp.]|uniref:carbohydrate-binding domain-containing protein n=1 Tax=Arenibaculum sp. TaxID=2865862 RepID=UPI002E16721F|nr:carbohydrate-binding domain-containing protein [Arenibaculum sp.]
MLRLRPARLLAPLLAASACTTEIPNQFVAGPQVEIASLTGEAVGAAARPVVEFAVIARGEPAGGVAPLMALVVDGREIGRVSVGQTTSRYLFEVPVEELPDRDPLEVDVRYLNDRGAGETREDRNLFVVSLSVDGTEIPSYADGVRYFRVAGDVREEIPGQVSMFWGGALIFPVPRPVQAPAPAEGTPMG